MVSLRFRLLLLICGVHHGLNLGRQAEQGDEAGGIFLVIIAGAEGSDIFRIQGIIAPDTGLDDVALGCKPARRR